MSKAYLRDVNGSPGVEIDGVVYPPMFMTARINKHDYMKRLGESGIRVFFLHANTEWMQPGGFADFEKEAETLLSAVPDAYIIVRVALHPPLSWYGENPDELMRYSDGTTSRAMLTTEIYSAEIPAMYALYSEKWRTDAAKALMEFCDMVDTSRFSGHVIGFFLAAGGTSEWYPVNSVTGNGSGAYGDMSPAFRHTFCNYLRKKYRTEDALRSAWKMDDVTFDAPILPTPEHRKYINIDETILDALLNFERQIYFVDKKIDIDASGETNVGVFLNSDRFQYAADFYDAFHEGIADSIIHFSRALRNRYDGKLIGAFYGSFGCTDFYDAGTTTGTLAILDAGVLDFLAAPGTYDNREPGGYVAQREMQDSFRLRGQMFIVEEDSRTHLEHPFYRSSMGLYTPEDAINTLKRDFARNICEDLYAWWFDQHDEGGRYQHQAFYDLFKRQQEIAAEAYAGSRVKNTEIALIYDIESVHQVSYWTNNLMLDLYRTSELARIGAPVDYYFHDDMARADMPDYKLYLMINTFCLTDAQREAIIAKAKKNGATLVWLYAPGFINPDSGLKMSDRHIESLTGMKIGRSNTTLSPRFRLTKERHPALRYGDYDRVYGFIDRDIHSNVWLGSSLRPPYMNPAFHIDDPDAEVLGRYCESGLAAFALKAMDGYTSVYCAPQILRAELIASVASYSGCHIYTASGDCLYANKRYLCVHAAYTGEREITFPTETSPYEVYEKRYYGRNVNSLKLNMRVGETLMFQLDKR